MHLLTIILRRGKQFFTPGKTSAKPAAENSAGHVSEGNDGGLFTCAKNHKAHPNELVRHKSERHVHTRLQLARESK
ncbi:MAG: hypothetical protein DME71_11240 [Verrucomicrobia bacterium]|nr:MAG: hypothetical protein DME71_11240 [Verrucomicrobiota bacterium]